MKKMFLPNMSLLIFNYNKISESWPSSKDKWVVACGNKLFEISLSFLDRADFFSAAYCSRTTWVICRNSVIWKQIGRGLGVNEEVCNYDNIRNYVLQRCDSFYKAVKLGSPISILKQLENPPFSLLTMNRGRTFAYALNHSDAISKLHWHSLIPKWEERRKSIKETLLREKCCQLDEIDDYFQVVLIAQDCLGIPEIFPMLKELRKDSVARNKVLEAIQRKNHPLFPQRYLYNWFIKRIFDIAGAHP